MTETKQRLPRFETGGRDRPEMFVEPLPHVLVELLGDDPAVVRHSDLAGHYEAAREKAVALAAELETAKCEDVERRRAALAKSRKPPAAKADGVEAELATARDDVSLLAEMLRASASELLSASVRVLRAADERAGQEAEAALDECERLADALTAVMLRADEAAAVSGWTRGLLTDGRAWPWRAGTRAAAASRTSQLVRQLPAALADDRKRKSDAVAETERQRAHAMRNLPPGTEVWRGGETVVVGENEGDAEEVEQSA